MKVERRRQQYCLIFHKFVTVSWDAERQIRHSCCTAQQRLITMSGVSILFTYLVLLSVLPCRHIS